MNANNNKAKQSGNQGRELPWSIYHISLQQTASISIATGEDLQH